jgi:hypothetical protein
MAKLTGPLMSNSASGQLKKQLTYLNRPSGASVGVFSKPGSRSPFTPSAAQVARRATYSEAVLIWNGFSEQKKAEYTAAAAPLRLSGFNYFIQLYLNEQCLLNGLVFYWKKLIINKAYVYETIANYPLYLDLSTLGSDFFGRIKSGGGDLRVLGSDLEDEKAREVVFCDILSQTGEAHTLISSLSHTEDTVLFVLYGNGEAADYEVYDPYGARAVWVDYEFVAHYQSGITDSSEQDHAGSTDNVTQVAAKYGNGYRTQGNSLSQGFIEHAMPAAVLNTGIFSVAVWVKILGLPSAPRDGVMQYIIGKYAGGAPQWGIRYADDIKFFNIITRSATSNITKVASVGTDFGVWTRVYYVLDRSVPHHLIYLNGVQRGAGTVPATGNVANTDLMRLGKSFTTAASTAQPAYADFDEISIFRGARSENYIKTEHVNQNSPATFYSVR